MIWRLRLSSQWEVAEQAQRIYYYFFIFLKGGRACNHEMQFGGCLCGFKKPFAVCHPIGIFAQVLEISCGDTMVWEIFAKAFVCQNIEIFVFLNAMDVLEVKLLRLGWYLICISVGCLCCHCSALIWLLLSGHLGIIPQTLQLVTQNCVLFLRR